VKLKLQTKRPTLTVAYDILQLCFYGIQTAEVVHKDYVVTVRVAGHLPQLVFVYSISNTDRNQPRRKTARHYALQQRSLGLQSQVKQAALLTNSLVNFLQIKSNGGLRKRRLGYSKINNGADELIIRFKVWIV